MTLLIQDRPGSTAYILKQLRMRSPVRTVGIESDLDPFLPRCAPIGLSDGLGPDFAPRTPLDTYAVASLSRRVIVSGNHPAGIVTDETDEYDNYEGYPLLGYILGTLGYTIKLREVLSTLTQDELTATRLNDENANDVLGSLTELEARLRENTEQAMSLELDVRPEETDEVAPEEGFTEELSPEDLEEMRRRFARR